MKTHRSMLARVLMLSAIVAALPPSDASAAELGKAPDIAQAVWIWAPDTKPVAGDVSYFRHKFVLPSTPVEATIALTADNGYEFYVNNERIAAELGVGSAQWGSIERFRIEKQLHEGANAIAIRGECLGGSAGVVAAIYIKLDDGREISFTTDPNWLSVTKVEGNWPEPDHDDSLWKPAAAMAKMGGGPWGNLTVPEQLTDPKTLVVNRNTPGRFIPTREDVFTEPDNRFVWPAGVMFLEGNIPVHSTQAATTKFPIPGTQSFYEYDTPAPAVSGRRLYTMIPAGPGTEPRLLFDAGTGLIASPTCSHDGTEIIFAMVPEDEKFYKLFRIGIDGSGLKRLTTGPWQDYDPAVLPDGRIVFASSRTGSRDEYHANTARGLFCLSVDRTEIRPLTYHIVADSEPAVMADGRVAFVRHDNFMERAKVETHIHAIHTDGSSGEVLIGPDRTTIGFDRATGAEDPASWLRNFGYGSPAPLSDGRVACISGRGPVITAMSLNMTAGNERMPSEVALFDIAPLPDNRLLCSTPRGVLGILDPDTGKVVKLVETPTGELHSVTYLGPHPKPPAMAPLVGAEDDQTHAKAGFLFCQNIFDTKQIAGDWDRVKAVRVIVGNPLTVRAARHQYGHIGTEGIELGTAPLAPDGSFFVRVPADRALAIQAIDAVGRPVVNELSWIYVRPGERRSCTGCHSHRQAAPTSQLALAQRAPAIDLLGQGTPHRFRANNAANGGVLNQQFDRFREAASIDLHTQNVFRPGFDATQLPAGRRAEVERLLDILRDDDPAEMVSAIGRLATLRDRAAVPGLVTKLRFYDETVRMAAAIALSSCGNREAVGSLLRALHDPSPHAAQAAHVALENLTGHSQPFNSYDGRETQAKDAAAWRDWIVAHDFETIEQELVARIASEDPVVVHKAIEALGHIGSEPARAAIRKYLTSGREDSLLARLAALRALGHLGDESAVPLLARILEENTVKVPLKPQKSHEFGWAAAPDHLAGAAAEALGWIGTTEAEDRLIAAYEKLAEFWYYTFRTADHSWLMGCHSSIPHYRIAEALDAIGSRNAVRLTGKLLESVPMDPDRGLLHENDAYEAVTARVIQRNGMGPQVVDACLAVLHDPAAKGTDALTKAVTASPPAVSVGILSPESRAAHLLSVVCLRPEDAARVRAAFERYRAEEPSRKRSWTCFFLARTLGKLRDRDSVDALLAALNDDPTELSFGVPEAPNVFIHNAMTPVHRAAAADALGRIGSKQSVDSLLAAAGNYENAMEVRQAAAAALGRIADPASLGRLEALADEYPEIATQRTLWEACAAAREER